MTAGQTTDRPGGSGVLRAGASRWADLDGPVHYLDFGGPADGPVIVCVHGLGGGSVNWVAVAPLLTGTCRVLAPDLAGHGLTQSLGRGTDVAENRALLHRFVMTVTGGPVILMGNSMGGMISLLEASAAPATVAGLVLLDPAVPFTPARPDPAVAAMFALYLTPGLRQVMRARRYRQAPAELVGNILRLCCSDPSRVAPEVVARHVEVATRRSAFPGIEADFAAAMRSVVRTVGYPHGRAYGRRIRSVSCPVLLIHGTEDRLVPLGAVRTVARANPAWSVREFPGIGHVPQLEAPGDTADAVLGWLGSAGARAAHAARAAHPPRPGEDGESTRRAALAVDESPFN